MKRLVWFPIAVAGALMLLPAQDVKIVLQEGQRPALAVPDFRGDPQAQPLMGAFNDTLWGDVQGSGFFRMVPKTMYPKPSPSSPRIGASPRRRLPFAAGISSLPRFPTAAGYS